MRSTAKSLLLVTLAVTVFCSQKTRAAEAQSKSGGMTAVINTVTIKGPSKAVFDLITTARLWPQWHPATKAVGGVVERPYGLDDSAKLEELGGRDR
jgi:hypothetical protein